MNIADMFIITNHDHSTLLRIEKLMAMKGKAALTV